MVLKHKKNKEGIRKEIFAGDTGREGGRERVDPPPLLLLLLLLLAPQSRSVLSKE